MNREEIALAIRKKIRGQGSAIDAGGALADILESILDLGGQSTVVFELFSGDNIMGGIYASEAWIKKLSVIYIMGEMYGRIAPDMLWEELTRSGRSIGELLLQQGVKEQELEGAHIFARILWSEGQPGEFEYDSLNVFALFPDLGIPGHWDILTFDE